MLATVKIIPLRRSGPPRSKAASAWAREGGPLLTIAPFAQRRVALIQTRLPRTQAQHPRQDRAGDRGQGLAVLGNTLEREERCGHAGAELAPMVGRQRAATASTSC